MKKTNATTATETKVEPIVDVTIETPKRRGRPVVEGSARQNRIMDLAERRANGTLKLGRPKMTTEQKEASKLLKEQFKAFLASQK